MTAFELIDNDTNELIAVEECLGNAMEYQMVLQEMGRNVIIVQVTQECAG